MKKLFLVSLSLVCSLFIQLNAQKLNDMVNLGRYQKSNTEVIETNTKKIKRVVFIGNSITDGWVPTRPDFFKDNDYVGRGIGGQTSPQLLLRFRQDILDLKPVAVVINIGTNDVAENTGTYNPKFTLDNIKSMAELADYHKIKVILSSVLPAGGFGWNPNIKDAPEKVDALNAEIKAYAKKKKFAYIDYNSAMRDENGAMLPQYANDGIHPTVEGYVVMEKLAKETINKVLKRKNKK